MKINIPYGINVIGLAADTQGNVYTAGYKAGVIYEISLRYDLLTYV